MFVKIYRYRGIQWYKLKTWPKWGKFGLTNQPRKILGSSAPPLFFKSLDSGFVRSAFPNFLKFMILSWRFTHGRLSRVVLLRSILCHPPVGHKLIRFFKCLVFNTWCRNWQIVFNKFARSKVGCSVDQKTSVFVQIFFVGKFLIFLATFFEHLKFIRKNSPKNRKNLKVFFKNGKNHNFDQKSSFGQNRNFSQKSQFSPKITIFAKKGNFGQK